MVDVLDYCWILFLLIDLFIFVDFIRQEILFSKLLSFSQYIQIDKTRNDSKTKKDQ